jgi:pimeloyl-ACP methyl ester carboxylesterase
VERDVALTSGSTRVQVEGEGRALVWTHGFTASMASEDVLGSSAFLRGLPGVKLVRYDARGHGGSAPGKDAQASAWHSLALDLLELADRLELARPVAGGASMGVATTLHAAVRAPRRFAGLLLTIPPTAWETRPAQAALYSGGAALVEARGVDAYLDAMRAAFRANPIPGFDESVQEAMIAALRAKTAPELAQLLRGAALSDLPDPDALRALDVPALILPVRGDPGHPLSTAERLHELLKGSALIVLNDLRELAQQRDAIARFVASVQ